MYKYYMTWYICIDDNEYSGLLEKKQIRPDTCFTLFENHGVVGGESMPIDNLFSN